MFSYYLNLTYDKRVYCELIWAIAKVETAFLTVFSFLAMERDDAPISFDWTIGSDSKDCRVRAELDGFLMAIPVVICQTVEHIRVLELLDGSVSDEMLGYVAFERAGEINRCAGDSTVWFDGSLTFGTLHRFMLS